MFNIISLLFSKTFSALGEILRQNKRVLLLLPLTLLLGVFCFKAHADPYIVPAKNAAKIYDYNWKKIYSMCYSETGFKDMVVFNVPGFKYCVPVKHFSIDIGAPQVNSSNFEWVYKKAIQLQKQGLIRKDLKLYKLPTEWVKQQELLFRKVGADKRYFKDYEFKCDNDCKESMFIYRVIIEKYRNKWDFNRDYYKKLINKG